MPTPTQTRRIQISVDTQGSAELKKIADQLGGLTQTTKSLADGFGFLTQGALAFITGLSIRQLADFSDQIEEMHNRLLATTGSQAEATKLMDELAQVARQTNGSLQGTVEVYAKIALALKAANINSQTTVEFTEALTNTFRLSGLSADAAAAAVTSLAYGMQQGELKGRELRTVLRENATLAQLLKQNFGGNLLSAANDGFITTASLMKIVLANMDSINSRAAQLQATFGQSLTKGMDAFKLKIFEVNESLGASSGFGAAINVAIRNMGSLITVLTIMTVATIPAMISQVVKLGVSLLALAPQAAALTAILGVGLAGAVALFGRSTDITELITQLKAGFSELTALIDDGVARLYDFLAAIGHLAPNGSAASNAEAGYRKLAAGARQAAQDARVHAQALWNTYEAEKILAEQQQKSADAALRRSQDLAKVQAAIQPDLDPRQLLSNLNREYREGAISISQYNSKLQDVHLEAASKEFRDGKIDLEKYNEAMDANRVFQYNMMVERGSLSLQDYDKAVRNVQLDKLNRELDSGKISLQDYNAKIASVSAEFSAGGAFRTGLQDYVNSIGTTTQQVAGLIKQTFSNLETALFDFVKKGKFNFDQFTQAVLDDLLKIIIRSQIIGPLAQGLLGVIGSPTPAHAGNYGSAGGSYTNYNTTSAHGNVFGPGGLMKFASGGIVGSPTFFGYNGGTGLMGEAGPEAILPLSRDGSGNLGVSASVNPVTINIINQNGSDVQQTESTGPNGDKQIDIMITSKVAQGISSGKFDKALKSSYGLQRKGV